MHLCLQQPQEPLLTYLHAQLCTQAGALFPPRSKGLSQDKKIASLEFFLRSNPLQILGRQQRAGQQLRVLEGCV